MTHSRLHRLFFIVLLILIAAGLWAIDPSTLWRNPHNGEITLRMPPFANIAKAESNQPATFADDEAGIAAYINVGQTIDLSKVDDLYRTISEQNSNYLIGSIDVPDYDENHSPTVYVHKDGWVMAYYRKTEPVSKLIDFRHYTGDANLPTKFEKVINRVTDIIGAASATPTYYHFAFPNANKMMLIAEKAEPSKSDAFQVNLPSSFQYFERSWSLASDDKAAYKVQYQLDGQKIGEVQGNQIAWEYADDKFDPAKMPVGDHSVTVVAGLYINSGYGGLGLIYKTQ